MGMDRPIAATSENADIVDRTVTASPDVRYCELLQTNAAAAASVASAVLGSFGPRGLNTALADGDGDFAVTSDAAAIVEKLDTKHPVSHLVAGAARTQGAQVGDGAATAVIIASALINEAVAQACVGVPMVHLLAGIRLATPVVLDFLKQTARASAYCDDPMLYQAARTAARGDKQIAALIIEAVRAISPERLTEDETFSLSKRVMARQGATTRLAPGLILGTQTPGERAPVSVPKPWLLLIDGDLAPERIPDEGLGTETGFQRHLQLQEDFAEDVRKLATVGANCVFVTGDIAPSARVLLEEARIFCVESVPASDLAELAAYTGGVPVSRAGLRRSIGELRNHLGTANTVARDPRLQAVYVEGGSGRPMVTILVGAATPEVLAEKSGIARKAAATVQAALRGGVLPGGGAAELAAVKYVRRVRQAAPDKYVHGVDCVIEALKAPMVSIVQTCGFSARQVEEALRADAQGRAEGWGISAETGRVTYMYDLEVVDAAPVKIGAFVTAVEVADAVLRISAIIDSDADTRAGALD